MYRTQINQAGGLRPARVLPDHFVDPTSDASFADNIRIDASGFGGNPTGSLPAVHRARATSTACVCPTASTRTSAPCPRSPTRCSTRGSTPGQHTCDRAREVIDLEFELLPGQHRDPGPRLPLEPLSTGPARPRYFVGQDEFRLALRPQRDRAGDLRRHLLRDRQLVGHAAPGLAHLRRQGRDRLAPGAGGGNNSQPVLGSRRHPRRPTRARRPHRAPTPRSPPASVTGRFGEAIRLTRLVLRADYEADTAESELLSGSLVSFKLEPLLLRARPSRCSRTDSPSWRGDARRRVRPDRRRSRSRPSATRRATASSRAGR